MSDKVVGKRPRRGSENNDDSVAATSSSTQSQGVPVTDVLAEGLKKLMELSDRVTDMQVEGSSRLGSVERTAQESREGARAALRTAQGARVFSEDQVNLLRSEMESTSTDFARGVRDRFEIISQGLEAQQAALNNTQAALAHTVQVITELDARHGRDCKGCQQTKLPLSTSFPDMGRELLVTEEIRTVKQRRKSRQKHQQRDSCSYSNTSTVVTDNGRKHGNS